MGLATIGVYSAYAALASAAVGSYTAYTSSKAQQDAQKEYNKSLEREAIRQYSELDEQESDAIKEANAESLQAQKEYMQARSTIELQAAATGTYGNSINTTIQDLKTGYGGRMAEIVYNREVELDNIDKQARNIQAGVGQSADRTVKKPAWYSAFQTGLGTYNSMYGTLYRVGTTKKNAEAVV